ncbi:Vta1 like-domain-containing protein [Syncephalastrum racemosum]|uniref:Vta1 like-domain-containing protein n=1 Tax=Syncephalastrum racemosum TaxID=13706 RepID=A0A1X2HP80_SYNRA|nr:Vta1 like-domain-containing protein [Syncephalastrum racemosum]
MEIPADLKFIAPYVQRGRELDGREPIVAYYAIYYAVQLAIGRGANSPESKAYVSKLLDTLEEWKRNMEGNNEALTNDLVGYAHVENFALKVFLNADNEDRSGKASKKTAKTFLAASVFLELLKTFGEIDPEVEGKIKYAKWKAADIMKALREGRTPTPGAPGEENDEQNDQQNDHVIPMDDAGHPQDMPVDPPSSISEFPSPPVNTAAQQPITPSPPDESKSASIPPPPPPAAPSSPPVSSAFVPSAPAPAPAPASAAARAPAPPPAATTSTPAAAVIDPNVIATAQKHAKWAISALNYDDIATARTQLLAALNDIGFNQANNYGH